MCSEKNVCEVIHQNVNNGYLNVRITGNLYFLCAFLYLVSYLK